MPEYDNLTYSNITNNRIKIINQIEEIYNFISKSRDFSVLIPEVRMNISASISSAKTKEDIAGVEGRITIINGFPKASGDIKFGVSNHTARLLLTAKEYDNSINFVMNLKYNPKWITLIKENTELELEEITREEQPEIIKEKEFSTMQWLIKKSYSKIGKIPDIIWDKGSIGKEPMMRLFGRSSKDMISKLTKIIALVKPK
jgi:hydroxymethylpyrimidine/phosphomethylpyrimidine kinase